jgi:DNA-binding transcriptional MocR family regulator
MRSSFTPTFSMRVAGLPPNAFVDLVPIMKDPTVHVLAQGVPPASAFPLKMCSFELADGSCVTLDTTRTSLAQRYPQFAWGELREWLLDHVRALHNPLCEWDVCIGAGSMSSVDIVINMLADRGDVVLVEEHTFTAALDVMAAAGLRVVPVPLDEHGIVPAALVISGVSPPLTHGQAVAARIT